MTQTEYENKKRECWEEYCQLHPRYVIPAPHFEFIFDRAYALGREKETITQEEIEEAAEDYVSFEKGGKCYPSYIVERACCCAFKDGANFALGKQEKDADTVIQGWVARDKDGEIYLYEDKPVQCSDEWAGRLHPEFDFQKLRWPSDPIEVEIIIKRKKNGNNCTDNRV